MKLPSTEFAETIGPGPGKFRRWLKSDMLVLRWVFLSLYVVLIASLFVLMIADDAELGVFILFIVMLLAQTILIFGSGTIRLCHPLRRRRLIMPVVIAAAMLTLLIVGLAVAAWELFYFETDSDLTIFFYACIALMWAGWGVMLYFRLRYLPRYSVLSRLTTYLFAGSLAELLATVPSHVIVSRRPGCLVGIGTMVGIIAGVLVMVFSFGPAIAILFLRPKYRAETSLDGQSYCAACGYDLRASRHRCPECGLPFEAIPAVQ